MDTEYMRKNDIEVKKLSKALHDHITIEESKFDELKSILMLQNDEMKKLREEIKPVVDAYSTANKVGTFVEWVSKKILAVGIIAGVIAAAIHYK